MASVNPVFLPLVAVGLAVCFASLLICIAIFASAVTESRLQRDLIAESAKVGAGAPSRRIADKLIGRVRYLSCEAPGSGVSRPRQLSWCAAH
jgi:hypothetical protein